MRSPTFITLLSLILLSGAVPDAAVAVVGADGTRLLHADSRGVSLEIRTGDPRLVPADPEFSNLDLPGFTPTGEVGEPALPARIVWVGIPEGVSVRVEASAIESRSFDDVRLAPLVLAQQEGDEPTPLAELASSPDYLSRSHDEPLAVLRTITGLRAQRVAGIELRPARYDARGRRLEVATRLSVRVSFVGAAKGGVAAAAEEAFEDVYRNVLVNYESARAFRRRPASTNAATGEPAGFDLASNWLRVRVSRKGIQQLRGSDLEAAGVSLAELDVHGIRLFTRPGLPVLPENEADPRGLKEVAIRIEGTGDGQLDPDDRILFFGLPASGWQDDFMGAGRGPSEWFNHPYETENVYWLALDAKMLGVPARWTVRDVSPAPIGAQSATRFEARLHFEQDLLYQRNINDRTIPWDPWAWLSINSAQSVVQVDAEVSGAIEGLPARLRARFISLSAQSGNNQHRMDVSFNDQAFAPVVWSGSQHRDLDTTTTHILDGINRLGMTVARPPSPASSDQALLLSWELRFARRFEAVRDTLEFSSAGIVQPADYTLAPFSDALPGAFLLLDVSDPLRPVELTGWQATDTTGGRAVLFGDQRDSSFYFAAGAAAWRTPAVERASIGDIRRGGGQYLVICADELVGEAQRLAAHRRSFAPLSSAAVVRMSDILAWYAGGLMDPVAIRNFLHDVVFGGNWLPAPTYVCLLGDATFDYKNVYRVGEPGLHRKQVPTFGHNYEIQQYPTDDWLVDVDLPHDPFQIGGAVPDLIVGRLPAANPTEAAALVDKVIAYDADPEYGPWRNRILTLVDDTYQGNQPDPIGTGHIEQADSLERGHVPAWLDRRKVELIEYPFTQGISKDGARQELLHHLDEGAVFWHYIGHANPFKLADENAFLQADVAALSNGSRQPFFFAASSATGPFDDPIVSSLAEALVKRPDGGTIASYAGTITTFSFANFNLGMALYDAMLTPVDQGGAWTIGEASFTAKLREFASQNDRKYHILGDPGTRLALPRDDLHVELYDDVTGESLGDSLPAGRRVRVDGWVHGRRNPLATNIAPDRTGSARIRVTDAPVRKTVNGPFGPVGYDVNARTAYDVTVPVTNTRFTATFLVPSEATLGPGARVSVYYSGPGVDGSGAVVSRLIPGEAEGGDAAGPAVSVEFANGGTIAAPGDLVTVTIEDPSGIRVLEDSPLDPVLVAFDGGQPIDVTKDFRYDAGSTTRGTVQVRLPDSVDGAHAVTITASDNLASATNRDQHRSQRSFEFQVAAVVASAEARALVLPNPFVANAGTNLVFTGLPGASSAEVRVYDVRGRLIRRLVGKGEEGHVALRWDGRDSDGAAVGTGIYLYRATVSEVSGDSRAFSGRLVLLN